MREVSVSEFAKAHAAGAAVIDVGDVEEYNRGHIPGAVSIPVQDMSRDLTAALSRSGGTRRCTWCAPPVTAA